VKPIRSRAGKSYPKSLLTPLFHSILTSAGVLRTTPQFMFQMSLSQSQRPPSCFQCTMYLANAAPFSPRCNSAWPISTAVSPAISTSSVVNFAPVIPSAAIPAFQNPLIASRRPEGVMKKIELLYEIGKTTDRFLAQVVAWNRGEFPKLRWGELKERGVNSITVEPGDVVRYGERRFRSKDKRSSYIIAPDFDVTIEQAAEYFRATPADAAALLKRWKTDANTHYCILEETLSTSRPGQNLLPALGARL